MQFVSHSTISSGSVFVYYYVSFFKQPCLKKVYKIENWFRISYTVNDFENLQKVQKNNNSQARVWVIYQAWCNFTSILNLSISVKFFPSPNWQISYCNWKGSLSSSKIDKFGIFKNYVDLHLLKFLLLFFFNYYYLISVM